MPTIPISDYEYYYRLAGRIAEFRPLTDLDWRSLNMSTWGYPVFLGLWFALFTQSLLLAKAINILFGVAAIFVFYRLSLFFGQAIGRVATLFFAIWPAQILYTSVLGSEHLGLLAALCAIWFVFQALTESNRSKWFSALAGLFFGMTYLTRTGLFLLVPVSIITILFHPLTGKQKAANLGILIITFIATIGGFYGSIKAVYGVLPVSNNLSTLLSGTNFESTGGWNIQDSEDFLRFDTVEQANAYAWIIAKNRIVSDPGKFVSLMLRKAPKMWADAGYGYTWSTSALPFRPPFKSFKKIKIYLEAAPQYFHIFILVLTILGCIRICVGRYANPFTLFLMGSLLAAILFHTVFEVQPRYHMPYSFIFFLLAAIGLMGISSKPTEDR